jgi:hypothetical protein
MPACGRTTSHLSPTTPYRLSCSHSATAPPPWPSYTPANASGWPGRGAPRRRTSKRSSFTLRTVPRTVNEPASFTAVTVCSAAGSAGDAIGGGGGGRGAMGGRGRGRAWAWAGVGERGRAAPAPAAAAAAAAARVAPARARRGAGGGRSSAAAADARRRGRVRANWTRDPLRGPRPRRGRPAAPWEGLPADLHRLARRHHAHWRGAAPGGSPRGAGSAASAGAEGGAGHWGEGGGAGWRAAASGAGGGGGVRGGHAQWRARVASWGQGAARRAAGRGQRSAVALTARRGAPRGAPRRARSRWPPDGGAAALPTAQRRRAPARGLQARRLQPPPGAPRAARVSPAPLERPLPPPSPLMCPFAPLRSPKTGLHQDGGVAVRSARSDRPRVPGGSPRPAAGASARPPHSCSAGLLRGLAPRTPGARGGGGGVPRRRAAGPRRRSQAPGRHALGRHGPRRHAPGRHALPPLFPAFSFAAHGERAR